MINFVLNGDNISYSGEGELTLLAFLRDEEGIISAKDGCSKQAACGACLVEINGKPKLSCVTKMKAVEGAEVYTLEGVPEYVRDVIAKAFVLKGAVQCGFCTPGFIMRTKILLQDNPNPAISEIRTALKSNLCRCTGYKKIEEAIKLSAETLKEKKTIDLSQSQSGVGKAHPKYNAYETAIGQRPFVDDLKFDGMLYGALKFSDHPRAKVLKIDTSKAEKVKGVRRVFTAEDIPGDQYTGLIFKDWPLMVDVGQTTNYIGDVLAGVVACDEETSRKAVGLITVEYEILEPVSDVFDAVCDNSIRVHPETSNVLENCKIKRGDADKALADSEYIVSGSYETQRVEHAFLETETAIARPDGKGGIELFSCGQGVYEDRRQVAAILALLEEKVRVILVPNGGGFGGKEDLSVQGHASLFTYLLNSPVKVSLTRDESIIMHPKRHPVFMDISLGCDKNGKLTALKFRAIGDTGAYASVGTKVLERVAGHATAGYFVPIIDLEAKTVYTNNIPSGAMRGFGVNQSAFAIDSCIDELCKKGGFDRWQFRYDNALVDGLTTATGQVLKGVGIRACLLKLKDEYKKARFSGLSCGIKNSGVGNAMPDFSRVVIEIKAKDKVLLQHGWTEMGQGVYTMAVQTLCHETGINPEYIEVKVDTRAEIKTGMTTSSRATALIGNAIIDASKKINKNLNNNTLEDLVGEIYTGQWICDWTTKPGDKVDEVITHYSYGYAAQLCVLDDNGNIETIYAAHDAGKIMNPVLFEGQIEGAVHMGTGYALTEDLPMKHGRLLSTRLRDCKVLRAHETPEIVVFGVEVKDEVGPYGAKGIGEIGLVPTAAAIANAFCNYDGVRRYKLPMRRK